MRVPGLDQLVRQLGQVQEDLGDLTAVNLQAARLVAADAGPRTPRRTGTLAAGTRASSTRNLAIISNATRYAVPVFGGVPARGQAAQPWLLATVERDTDHILDLYADRVQAITERT